MVILLNYDFQPMLFGIERSMGMRQPSKEEFLSAMFGFAAKLMFAYTDGRISKDEFEGLIGEFLNAGLRLYGVKWKVVKEVPDIVASMDLHD